MVTCGRKKILQPLQVNWMEIRRQNRNYNWQSKAENWMLRAQEIKDKDASSNKDYSKNRDYLKTSKIKDYGQPL